MKKQFALALMMLLPLTSSAAEAPKEKAKTNEPVVQKVESDSAVKRLLDQMWSKLRSYAPKQHTSQARGGATVIAGVRGAESTDSQLKPYWKGDRTADPAYAKELSAYQQAEALVEAGKPDKAATGFEEFLKTYPESALKPNARFALGLSYSAAGDKSKSRSAFEGFIKDYPTHPLTADAKRMTEALQAQ